MQKINKAGKLVFEALVKKVKIRFEIHASIYLAIASSENSFNILLVKVSFQLAQGVFALFGIAKLLRVSEHLNGFLERLIMFLQITSLE